MEKLVELNTISIFFILNFIVLSSNKIIKITGLNGSVNLTKISLSHNKIMVFK